MNAAVEWQLAVLGILLLCQISSARSYAAKVDDRWAVHVVAGGVSTADDVVPVAATQSGPITIGEATHGVGDGDGFGLGLEYRATRRMGTSASGQGAPGLRRPHSLT